MPPVEIAIGATVIATMLVISLGVLAAVKQAPWIPIFPGLATAVTAFGFNLLRTPFGTPWTPAFGAVSRRSAPIPGVALGTINGGRRWSHKQVLSRQRVEEVDLAQVHRHFHIMSRACPASGIYPRQERLDPADQVKENLVTH